MRTICLFLTLLLVTCQARDNADAVSPDAYLGESPPGIKAQLFSPGFISTEDEELNSVFSSDFQKFYFTRRGIPTIPPRIMVSRRGSEGWEVPESAGFDQRYSAIDLFLSQDGRQMVFCSNRPSQGGDTLRVDHDFWVSMREGMGWRISTGCLQTSWGNRRGEPATGS